MPNLLTLLLWILLACAIATYIVPAGAFEVGERNTIIPGTYGSLPKSPVSPIALLASLHIGLVDSASIIFGVLVTGGALAVLGATGTVSGAIGRLAARTSLNRYVLATAVMVFFGVTAATGTITSEVVAFIPVGLMIARALGLKPVTGLMIVLLPNTAGYSASFLNPSSLALAQRISGLPVFSGIGYRVALFLVFLAVTVIFVLLDIRRTLRTADPNSDRQELVDDDGDTERPEFGRRHKLALAAFAAVLALFVVGTATLSWGVEEMAGCFFLIALITAVIFRMTPSKTFEHFVDGMKSLVFVTLVIGVARAITVVLQEGRILDTLVYALGNLVSPLPAGGGALALLATGGIVNFFVGSGTGQAALTIPIIAPLTDLMGLSRQLGVLSFQLSDGITNMLFPTSSVLMAGLALAGVSFGRWVRVVAPYLAVMAMLAAAAMIVGIMIGYR